MSDAFEVLGLPRKLVLEGEVLADRYRALSKELHPDAGGARDGFERLGAAYEQLSTASGRLRAALEIVSAEVEERGVIPNEVMNRFGPVAEVIERVDGFVSERGRAKTALSRALLDGKVPELQAALQREIGELEVMEKAMTERFAHFDGVGWEECVEAMAELSRGLVFLEKWRSQLKGQTGKLYQALLGT